VVGLYKGARTYSYTYRAIYIGTSPSIYKGALSRCKVHRSLYIETSLMFLDLGLIYFLFL